MTRAERLMRIAITRYITRDLRIPYDLIVALLYAGIIITPE